MVTQNKLVKSINLLLKRSTNLFETTTVLTLNTARKWRTRNCHVRTLVYISFFICACAYVT